MQLKGGEGDEMQFKMLIGAEIAQQLVNKLTAAALEADQQWDYIQFDHPTVGMVNFQVTGIEDIPAEFTEMQAFSMSSEITLKKLEGTEWEFSFKGKRGSLGHWRLSEEILKEGALCEYQTSIPGMLPWEGVRQFFTRMTGEELMPDICPVNQWWKADAFHKVFYPALKELVKKGSVTRQNLLRCRNVAAAVAEQAA